LTLKFEKCTFNLAVALIICAFCIVYTDDDIRIYKKIIDVPVSYDDDDEKTTACVHRIEGESSSCVFFLTVFKRTIDNNIIIQLLITDALQRTDTATAPLRTPIWPASQKTILYFAVQSAWLFNNHYIIIIFNSTRSMRRKPERHRHCH